MEFWVNMRYIRYIVRMGRVKGGVVGLGGVGCGVLPVLHNQFLPSTK